MNSLSLTPSSTTCNSSNLPTLKPLSTHHHHHHRHLRVTKNRQIKTGRCKAAIAHEAPFVVAMGASIINSLVFPLPVGPNDNEDGESMIESADARFAVMGIISFIPYFNWMSWVFAWMDTMDKRYAAYSVVYLAPYLRSNLSISPDESWLPITSIILCIIHIQLEASIKNGDLQAFQLFKKASSNAYTKKDITVSEQETRKDEQNLPSANDEVRDKIRGWGIPKKSPRQTSHMDEGEEEKKQ